MGAPVHGRIGGLRKIDPETRVDFGPFANLGVNAERGKFALSTVGIVALAE